jgi:hypothetical protein
VLPEQRHRVLELDAQRLDDIAHPIRRRRSGHAADDTLLGIDGF